MCCFSTPTQVFQTNIFARRTGAAAQLLVYQMRYASKEPTAMILPLPVALPAREASVRWKSLKEHPGFFDDLAAGFPALPHHSLFPTKGEEPVAAAARAIEVHEVGDFIASFVPRVEDFDRVDARFAIKKDVWSKIPAYADYGFAVFQLKALSGTPHPIAFDFDSRLPDTAYFPTVHIHDGTVHAEDTFDHVLYLQEARLDAKAGDYEGPDHVDPGTGLVRSKGIASSFADVAGAAGALDGGLLVHRRTINGTHPNVDTLVALVPAASSVGCTRCESAAAGGLEGSGPLAVAPAVLGALGWVIRRRDRLRGS